jgi:hypothetical protein
MTETSGIVVIAIIRRARFRSPYEVDSCLRAERSLREQEKLYATLESRRVWIEFRVFPESLRTNDGNCVTRNLSRAARKSVVPANFFAKFVPM